MSKEISDLFKSTDISDAQILIVLKLHQLVQKKLNPGLMVRLKSRDYKLQNFQTEKDGLFCKNIWSN